MPRTVDRCPVCGVPRVPEGTEVIEETGPIAPAWQMSPEPQPPARDDGPQLPDYTPPSLPPKPRDYSQAPGATDQSVSFDAPPPPSAPAEGTGAIHPGPTGAHASPRRATPGPTASEVPPPPVHDIGTSAAPLPSIDDETRVARAASNRVEGNFKIGKKPQHGIAVIAASIAAVVCLVGGAAAGSLLPEPGETLAYNDDTTVSGDALNDEAIALWADTHGDAFVNVMLDGCVPQTSNITGIALDPRIVLVAATDIESDTTPTVVRQDGTRHEGRTVGVLTNSGFAVVRLTSPLPTHLSWGPMTNVREGMNMRVATFSGGTVDVRNDTITQLRRTSTGVVGMDVMARAPQGSVILDSNNLVIGLTTRSGTFAADSDELSPKVSNAVLNQQQIDPVCPVVAEDGTEGEDGEG